MWPRPSGIWLNSRCCALLGSCLWTFACFWTSLLPHTRHCEYKSNVTNKTHNNEWMIMIEIYYKHEKKNLTPREKNNKCIHTEIAIIIYVYLWCYLVVHIKNANPRYRLCTSETKNTFLHCCLSPNVFIQRRFPMQLLVGYISRSALGSITWSFIPLSDQGSWYHILKFIALS